MATHLLIWDAPNMDASLGELLGRIPLTADRPNLGRLMNWFADQAKGEAVEAIVFVNVNKGPSNPKFHSWLRFLSTQGYRIYAKPKTSEDSDVDDAMLAKIAEHVQAGDLSQVVVASHDARCFVQPLKELAAQGIRVTVLGFSELINGWDDFDRVLFIDLEELPVFGAPLPRHINIWSLPEEGRFFEPSGRPRAELQSTPRRPRRVNPGRSAKAQSAAGPTLVPAPSSDELTPE